MAALGVVAKTAGLLCNLCKQASTNGSTADERRQFASYAQSFSAQMNAVVAAAKANSGNPSADNKGTFMKAVGAMQITSATFEAYITSDVFVEHTSDFAVDVCQK